jgi:hypothetical protein
MQIFTFAMHSIGGTPMRMISKCQQRRHVVVCNEPYIAAATTVTTIRATHGHWAFTTERNAASTAVAAAYIQLGFVNKGAHRGETRLFPYQGACTVG